MDNESNELITNKEEWFHYTNTLTKEMDKHLIDSISRDICFTYIFDEPNNNRWLIRYPGATRGYLEVDDSNIIRNIVLYDDEYHTDRIYKPEVRECFKKYIGMKFVVA